MTLRAIGAGQLYFYYDGAWRPTPGDDGTLVIGDSYAGGYIAGIIDTAAGDIAIDDAYQVGRRYYLIAAPNDMEVIIDGNKQWASSNQELAATKTRWDGLSSTQAMLDANTAGSPFEAAEYVSGLSTPDDGHSPWYIPALDELELIYRNFKPTSDDNATGNTSETFPNGAFPHGQNLSSDPQDTDGFSNSPRSPDATTIPDFTTGQPQAYSTSTQTRVSSTWASTGEMWVQDFGDGWQFGMAQNSVSNLRIRPVRRVYLDGELEAPTEFVVLPGNTFNMLFWIDPTAAILDGINVYRSTTSGSGYSLIDTVAVGTEQYKDEGLDNETTYYYVLTAIDTTDAESSQTAERSSTPEQYLIEVAPRIAGNADDGFVWTPYNTDGSFNSINGTANTTLDHIYVGNGSRAYFRFQLNVPQGTVIDAANVTFISRANRDTESTSVTIRAWDVDNATQFANTSDFATGWGNRTTASVSWSGSGSKTTNGQTINTPDIKAVIQEIVDRDGWESGNYVTLIMNGSNDSYAMRPNEYLDGSGRATLNVTYEDFSEPLRPMVGFTSEGREGYNVSAPTWKNGQLITGDALTWFNGLAWYITSGGSTVSDLIDNDNIYEMARPVRDSMQSMLAVLRVTGDLRFLDKCVEWWDEAADVLDVGWRGTSSPPSHGSSPYRTWVVRGTGFPDSQRGTDFSRMNETKWHAGLVEFMDALKANFGKTSPAEYDYEDKYDFWMEYLTDDFMPKWRDGTFSTSGTGDQDDYEGRWMNGDTTRAPSGQWPVVIHAYEGHSTVSSTHHGYYWDKLVTDAPAAAWAEDILTDWFATDCLVYNHETYGDMRVWRHSLISQGGAETYSQGMIYAGNEGQDHVMLYLEGAHPSIVTAQRLTEMSRAIAVWGLMPDYTGLGASSEAAYYDILGEDTHGGSITTYELSARPTLTQVVYFSTMWHLVFEDESAPSITDRAIYAQNTAGGGFNTPTYPHVPAALLVKEALRPNVQDSVPLSIPADAVASNLTDFPVYVDLSLLPDAFWNGVQGDGGDIRVYDGDTRLALELVSIDRTAKTGTMYFLAPSVNTTGSDFEIRYGGWASSQPAVDASFGRNAVWADYAVVWHTAQSPDGSAPQMVDSTGNGNDGTVSGAASIDLITDDGPYGVSLDMASKDSGVGKTSPVGLPSSPVSWSWWTKHDSVFVDSEDGWFGVGDSGSSSSTAYSTYFRPTVGSGRAQTYLSDGSNNPTTNAGSQVTTADVWYFWTTTHDQSSIRQYRNGSKTVTDAAAMTATPRTHAISMSRNGSSNRGLLGRMAEFRIRSGTLSDDWIAAEYANAINAGAFLGVGEGQVNLYVATTGNDTTGNGSEGNPYATITKAATEATAGTTIHVAAGTYAGGFTTGLSGTNVARVKYLSTTPHGAVIDGDGESYCWRNDGNYVTVEGFEMSGANTGSQIDGFRNYGHHTIFRGNHVYDIAQDSDNTVSGGGYAEHGDASGDALIEGNLIHHIANEVTPRNNLMHGIYPKQRPVIHNNIIYRIADSGIHLYHPSVALNGSAVNNLVFQCEKGIFAATDDNYIANNIVLDCSQGIRNGSLSVAQENVTVTNNLVYDCADPFVPTDAGEFPRSNTVTTDPLLVNYQSDGSGDYRLLEGSPAIDAGTSTGAPETDYNGVARDGTPNIGPFEDYVAALTPTLIDFATGTSSVTVPSHQNGDWIVVLAFRDGSTTVSLADGYTNVYNNSNNSTYLRVGYIVSDGTITTSSGWTNSSKMIALVYRGVGGFGDLLSTNYSDNDTTIDIPELTLEVADNTSIVLGFAGHREGDNDFSTPPDGMTLIDTLQDGNSVIAAYSTTTGVSTWAGDTLDGGGSASGRRGFAIEIKGE